MAAAAAAHDGEGQQRPASDGKDTLASLSAFDYATRTNAARMLRRTAPSEAVPRLTEAVRSHPDQFVRYRALVLLTAFNDRDTSDLMRALLTDRNDRVRELAYRWFERHPDQALIPPLLAALTTEQSEFVRPALVRALAPLGRDPQVQKALLVEVGRGLDFFRSAVIQALGDHRATYAVEAIAPIAEAEGPLQDDAVLALGRIGGARALSTVLSLTTPPLDVIPAVQAARCLIEDGCAVRVEVLSDTARSRAATPAAARAAVMALGAVAANGHAGAIAALVALAGDAEGRLMDDVAVAFSAAALRAPVEAIGWLAGAGDDVRAAAIELLRHGFERLEEDFAEEQFFAAARAAYWKADEGSVTRTVAAALIDTLEF